MSCRATRLVASTAVVTLLAASSFGFILERPAGGRPRTWDITPLLEMNDPRTNLDRVLDGKMQGTVMNKVLQINDARKQIGRVEDSAMGKYLQQKPLETILENVPENAANATKLIDLMEEGPVSANGAHHTEPRNVVLLFMDDTGENRDETCKSLKDVFPVHGFLQSCHADEPGAVRFIPKDALVALDVKNRKDSEEGGGCKCEHFLRSNLGALLSWADHVRQMSTGVVSTGNLSIPGLLGHDETRRTIVGVDENSKKTETISTAGPRVKRDFKNGWHVTDFGKRAAVGPLSAIAPSNSNPQVDGKRDDMWDILDIFSKIRMAFFRSLLESMNSEPEASGDSLPHRKGFSSRPHLVELLAGTIKELKSAANEKGYILVATASRNDVTPAVEFLRREISPRDTLVVAGTCAPDDSKPVPYFAQGPGSKELKKALTLWELPISLRDIIGLECHGVEYADQHRTQQQFLSSLPHVDLRKFIEDENDAPRKRVARTGKEMRQANSAQKMKSDRITMLLGIATSLITLVALVDTP